MARFQELVPNRGVDSAKSGEEWMMVPLKGDNFVVLADGAGFSWEEEAEDRKKSHYRHHFDVYEVTSSERVNLLKDATSKVTKNDRILRVNGRAAGPAWLEATKGGAAITIKVTVHKPKPLPVAFFFLQDPDAKGATDRSKFKPADADAWIKGLNGVYLPQANISFEFKPAWAYPLPISQLPTVVGVNEAKILKAEAAKLDKSGAKIKIFLAGKNISSQGNKGETSDSHLNGFFHVEEKIIIMKDREESSTSQNPMLQTMAHEIGHWLTDDHKGGQGHEFYKTCGYPSDILNTMNGNDIKIPKQRVFDWNPW